jgi:hypothetical protein
MLPHRSFGAHCPRMLIVQRKHAIELSSLTKGNGTVSQITTSVEYANNALSYYHELHTEFEMHMCNYEET